MDLQDWVAVSNQLSKVQDGQRRDNRIQNEEARTKIYQDREDLSQQRTERQWSREDEEAETERQATEIFLKFTKQGQPPVETQETTPTSRESLSEAVAPPPSAAQTENPGQDGQSARGLPQTMEAAQPVQTGTAPQGVDLSGYSPEAIRRAKADALEWTDQQRLRNKKTQTDIKENADAMTVKFHQGLSSAAQKLSDGNEDGAWSEYIKAYNESRPDGTVARRDKRTGEIILKHPDGSEERKKPRPLGEIIASETARATPDLILKEDLLSRREMLKYNKEQARAGGEPMVDATGKIVGYAVSMINAKTRRPEIHVYDRKYGLSGYTEITDPETLKGLMLKADAGGSNLDPFAKQRTEFFTKLSVEWQKANLGRTLDSGTVDKFKALAVQAFPMPEAAPQRADGGPAQGGYRSETRTDPSQFKGQFGWIVLPDGITKVYAKSDGVNWVDERGEIIPSLAPSPAPAPAPAPSPAPAAAPPTSLADTAAAGGLSAPVADPEPPPPVVDNEPKTVDKAGTIWGATPGNPHTHRVAQRPSPTVYNGRYINPEYLKYLALLQQYGLPDPADPLPDLPVAKN